MVGRCARGQNLGGPYHGGGLTQNTEAYVYIYFVYAPASLLPPGMVIIWRPSPRGPVVVVDGCDCWLVESQSLQVVLNPVAFARNSAKCGKNGKYGRQVA